MARHRGKFDKNKIEPYELSRSRIENFVKCKACFYMEQVEGIKFPSIPGFNINEATDILLKRDFDKYREIGEPHPFLVAKNETFSFPSLMNTLNYGRKACILEQKIGLTLWILKQILKLVVVSMTFG